VLGQRDFESIFETIEECFNLQFCDEITIEANPDDLNGAMIGMLRQLPFNRVSIGVQSLSDTELKAINRRHDAATAVQAIETCARLSFDNISIDLMYGLPGQTPESFSCTLDRALELPVQHISSYALSWEEGSVLYVRLQEGSLKQAPDEMLESCYFMLLDRLEEQGFHAYELSNFAKTGYRSIHNSAYWEGVPYLGVGPSAHSYDTKQRRYNPSSVTNWMEGVQKRTDFRTVEVLDERTNFNEFVMTRLRRFQGLDLNLLAQRFGPGRRTQCLSLAGKSLRNGTLELDGPFLRLTRKGLFISDGIISDLLDV